MASHLLNQPLSINLESFSAAVNRLMKDKEMTQADLVMQSCLSKTTISRICRNSNDKGGAYTPTEPIIMALSTAFRLSSMDAKNILLYAAFPERAFWDEFLDHHLGIYDINMILDENGLPLLGNMNE